jgi:hypothetical protein
VAQLLVGLMLWADAAVSEWRSATSTPGCRRPDVMFARDSTFGSA